MKKLSFNSTLNHKRDSYDTYEVSVEKVITLCGDEFSKLKNFTLKEITKGIAVKAHCGDKRVYFEDVLNEETMDEIKTAFIQAVGEMLEQREDIRSVQINELDIPFQSEIEVEAKPLHTEEEMEISRNEKPEMNLKM